MNERLIHLIATRQATPRDLEGVRPEDVWAVKSNTNLVQFSVKSGPAEVVNEEKRVLRYTWTDESVDADGDIVRLSGWDLTRFVSNPVFLWGHDGKETPPIGKGISIQMEPSAKIPRSMVDVEYAPKEAFEFADTIYQLAKRGFVNATSAGFRVTKVSDLSKEQREKLGLGPWGIEAVGQQLFEISNVSLPANENALRAELKLMVDQGVLADQTVRGFEKTFPLTEQDFKKRLKELTKSFIDFGATKKQPDATLEVRVDPGMREHSEALTKLVDACSKMVETNTRLVSAISDLTKRVAVMGDVAGGVKAPEAVPSEAPAKPATKTKPQADAADIEKLGQEFISKLSDVFKKK